MSKRGLYIFILCILLLFSNSVVRSQSLLSSYVYYTIITEYTFHNVGNTTIFINSSNISPGFYLALDIDGWQKLLNFSLYKDDILLNDIIVEKDDSGNRKILTRNLLKLEPRNKITLKLIQVIRVNTVSIFSSSRKKITLPKKSPMLYTKYNMSDVNNYLYSKGFWNISKNIEEISNNLANNVATVNQYILSIIRWTLNNIKYNISKSGGIIPPELVVIRKTGACGEISSLIVSLARAKGIPSYLYLAYYYDPKINMSNKNGLYSYEMIHVFQHVFAMVYIDDITSVPIDLTLPKRKVGEELETINGAGINTMDRIIILNKITHEDPNEFLMVASPDNNISMRYKVIVIRKNPSIGKGIASNVFILLFLLFLIIAVILLFLRDTENL